MSDLLFATPWWLLATLIVVGAIVGWTGIQRRQSGSRNVGIALILLAIGLKTLSYFVETDKEICERQSNELVASVQKRDWVKFTSLMESDVSLDSTAGSISANRDQLLEYAKDDTVRYNLTDVSGHVTKVEQDPTGVTVDIDASSKMDATFGYAVPSSWRLTWQRDGKDWRLHEITCLRIGNLNANEFAGKIK